MGIQERYRVRHEGEEKTVHNTISYLRPVRFYPNSVEKFEPQSIASGDGMSIEYVTASLAERVMMEDLIDLEAMGLEVIDVESDEVEIL